MNKTVAEEKNEWLANLLDFKTTLNGFCNTYADDKYLVNIHSAMQKVNEMLANQVIVPEELDQSHPEFVDQLNAASATHDYINTVLPKIIERLEKFAVNTRITPKVKTEVTQLADKLRPICPSPVHILLPKRKSSPDSASTGSTISPPKRKISFADERDLPLVEESIKMERRTSVPFDLQVISEPTREDNLEMLSQFKLANQLAKINCAKFEQGKTRIASERCDEECNFFPKSICTLM